MLLSLSTSAFCLYKHHTQQPTFKVVTKPIAETQLGANVPGVNPLEPDDLAWGTRVDPQTWRSIVLTAQQDDGSDVELQLLQLFVNTV